MGVRSSQFTIELGLLVLGMNLAFLKWNAMVTFWCNLLLNAGLALLKRNVKVAF